MPIIAVEPAARVERHLVFHTSRGRQAFGSNLARPVTVMERRRSREGNSLLSAMVSQAFRQSNATVSFRYGIKG